MAEPQYRIVLSTGKGRFYWTGNISFSGPFPTSGWSEDSFMLPMYNERVAKQKAEDIRTALHPVFTDIVIAIEPSRISVAEEMRKRGRMAEG